MGSVCLVIPYYEAGESLTRSLRSVHLRPDDFIIVIDDGSTDFPARDFCLEMANGTPVQLVECAENGGITKALLAGIDKVPADFTYIARLDCGDICAEDRFEIQRAYLDEHPECGLVGSLVEYVDASGKSLYVDRLPIDARAIRRRMRVNSAFSHPASMYRRTLYDAVGGYSLKYPAAEDYAMFRAMLKLADGANIDRALVKCTTAVDGISDRNRKRQLLTRIQIIMENFDWHPLSFYGVARASAQLVTSREYTTRLRKLLSR